MSRQAPFSPLHGWKVSAVAGWWEQVAENLLRRNKGVGWPWRQDVGTKAYMLHCLIRIHLQNTDSKIKLLRISRQLLQNINSQVSEHAFLGRSHVLEADPIHDTKPDYFISDFYIFYHSNCVSMLKLICTVAFLKFNISMERA